MRACVCVCMRVYVCVCVCVSVTVHPAEKGLVWTHNAAGEEVDLPTFVGSLPRDVRQLCDDPMRSLAALVRSRGGYDKVWVPFSEFRWVTLHLTVLTTHTHTH